MGFLISQVGDKPIANHSFNFLIIICVPLLWGTVCGIYFPEMYTQGSIIKTLDSLFNTKHAFESMGKIHRKLGFIYPVGTVLWFGAVFNLSGIRVGVFKDGNAT